MWSGPTTPFNELFVTTKPNENPTVRGGTLYGGYDQQNSGRLLIQSLIPFAQRPFPQVNVGDSLTGVTAGPVDYSRFGGYMIQATELGTVTAGGIQRETTRAQRDNELAVATYNVENLDPTDPATSSPGWPQGIVTNLSSPDIVALEEIQDNNGPTNDGTVAADQTLDLFTAAIVAAGGPQYEWRQIDPVNLADGGEPGGNIRVGVHLQPGAGHLRRPSGRRRDDRGRRWSPDRTRSRGSRCRPAGSTRRARPGPTAASRSSASSSSTTRPSSWSPTTSTPRAATSRCSVGSSRRPA